MNFLSLSFYAFIPLFLIIYHGIPRQYRYVGIFAGSYLFYGFANIKLLSILIVITAITYVGGLIIEKKRCKLSLATFFFANIIILLSFKYLNFAITNLNLLRGILHSASDPIASVDIILPAGLSFIVFQSCTYLTDIYRRNIKAEKNIIKYASFVAFFPTVLSGPIQKARELLPQISQPASFDAERAKKGTILFIWGLFEKILVANRLLIISNTVFGDYTRYSSAYYVVAAISFSLYIYADFSSYSDMARGIAMLMGIQIGKNFNNPYLSCTTSEFWNRWHISLNSWFIENIYIPLGGNRKGSLRKYVNVFIVFLISGLWHGADYHFAVWGIVNGILVILGQIIKPLKAKIYQKIKIDENLESIRFCKRVIVFWLISLTWVFFSNGVMASLKILKQLILLNPVSFFDQKLLSISGTAAATFVTVICAYIFCRIQVKRQHETEAYNTFSKQPVLFQTAVLGILICACIFAVCATDAAVNTQFLYFQF